MAFRESNENSKLKLETSHVIIDNIHFLFVILPKSSNPHRPGFFVVAIRRFIVLLFSPHEKFDTIFPCRCWPHGKSSWPLHMHVWLLSLLLCFFTTSLHPCIRKKSLGGSLPALIGCVTGTVGALSVTSRAFLPPRQSPLPPAFLFHCSLDLFWWNLAIRVSAGNVPGFPPVKGSSLLSPPT